MKAHHTEAVGREQGFTLIEMIVVLTVLGILAGTGLPLAGAVVQAGRRQEVQRELAAIADALDSYWFQNAAFPASLTAPGFLGVHLQPGVGNDAVLDPFGAGAGYVYAADASTGIATVHSRGENGSDQGAGGEEFVQRVHASVPATRRTWQRLRLIAEVLANHIEAGGVVTGNWTSLRRQLGLGSEYAADGWGTPLDWTPGTWTLRSAGPDRTLATADDITL